MKAVEWSAADWLNPPVKAVEYSGDLGVECAKGSDFWRTTYYGFVRDSGHALLHPFREQQAVEVSFRADFSHLYDQAGLMVRASETSWVKAGIEMSDGVAQLGAVVTAEVSDWSCAPVPEWAGQLITMRASWRGDALTIRARAADWPWRTLRLAPFAAGQPVQAGPYCCSPERAGLQVRFRSFSLGSADESLHDVPG